MLRPNHTFATRGGHPVSQRIFEALREQMRNGTYAPGSQLPSTHELAAKWKASVFTVHTALTMLANEGWIERRPYVGTFIQDPAKRFLCAGIYHAFDISSGQHTAFGRYLHFSLLQQLGRLKKDTQVFNDSRPPREQGSLFPPLAEAIAQRKIQCLIALSVNRVDMPALSKLTLPTAYVAISHSAHQVGYDIGDMVRGSVRHLAQKGCRSVGIISSITEGGPLWLYRTFQSIAKEEGMETREAWMRRPKKFLREMEIFGYEELKALWALKEKPEGLIIYPDSVAQGATTAILEIGINVVPRQMKFVFHRNAHLGFLCPFHVTWAVSDEDHMARELIELIQKQFAGEEAGPVYLPFAFRKG